MASARVALVLVGGLIGISAASSAAIKLLQAVSERKGGLSCLVCRGVGYRICKLCKGNSTIHWSPLCHPVAFNPCLCPTCDGHRVQRCLNCLGKGYS
uniref:Uncharacterized protein n=1 Tax=Kalanchoe fedtschenkoi TaxID=63787 RepID=A0A7N0THG5_KALFE